MVELSEGWDDFWERSTGSNEWWEQCYEVYAEDINKKKTLLSECQDPKSIKWCSDFLMNDATSSVIQSNSTYESQTIKTLIL